MNITQDSSCIKKLKPTLQAQYYVHGHVDEVGKHQNVGSLRLLI